MGDGFGAVHRKHASVFETAKLLPRAAGKLISAEVEVLQKLTMDPVRPYGVILGGAKVSDKIGVISNLLEKVDVLAIGGGMLFTFLAAQGSSAGSRSAKILIVFPPTVMVSSVKVTGSPRRPRIESYFKRCAKVALSVRSLIPTISIFEVGASAALKKFLPIRPNPLIPTLTTMTPLPKFPLAGTKINST